LKGSFPSGAINQSGHFFSNHNAEIE
jgi:hypothetical protein